MWDYCSIWWCLYASAFVKAKETQDWCAKCIHPSVSIGKGAKRAQEMASNLQEAYVSGGFAASSDWTQAYDRMKPEITTKTLTLCGFPPRFFCHFDPSMDGTNPVDELRWAHSPGATEVKSDATRMSDRSNGTCHMVFSILSTWMTDNYAL